MTTIRHFIHPNCILTPTCRRSFICNGCGFPGCGISYRCNRCNFDLHEHCAKHPRVLSCSMHCHSLTLTHSVGVGSLCSFCNRAIGRLVYRCVPCGFVVHPVCVRGRRW